MAAFERLRRQCPPSNATLQDAQQSTSSEGVTEERFEHDVALLKEDMQRAGLTSILWGTVVMLAITILSGFILDEVLFKVALFVLLGGASWYFMRKQKNYELSQQIDRELLGRDKL